jgi:hypothetical protein
LSRYFHVILATQQTFRDTQEPFTAVKMATTSASAALLGRQLKQMQTDKDIPGISCGLVDGNVYEWEVMLMISDECKFYGGESLPASLALSVPSERLHMHYLRLWMPRVRTILPPYT